MESLERRLGYAFHDRSLLSEALNHSSYANEHRGGLSSNERLEFLGDSVLGFVSAEFLFKRYGELPEGDLTRMRAALVCEQSLYGVAKELGLGGYLKLGRGEEAGGGRERQSILADSVEAVFAAVYLDGGIEEVRSVIWQVLLSKAPAAEERRDYKTTLQEVVQRRSGQALTYHMVAQSGPDHNKKFLFEVRLNDEPVGQGEGRSKKEAEQMAAKAAVASTTMAMAAAG